MEDFLCSRAQLLKSAGMPVAGGLADGSYWLSLESFVRHPGDAINLPLSSHPSPHKFKKQRVCKPSPYMSALTLSQMKTRRKWGLPQDRRIRVNVG